MSGLNDQDARALTYLARRIRQETTGAAEWDEAGIYAKVTELRGQSLAQAIERVTRHAADIEARTPGAILRPFTPAAAGPVRPSPPRAADMREEVARDKQAATPPTDDWMQARTALKETR